MKHYVKIIRYRVVNEPLRGIALAEGEVPESQPQIMDSKEFECEDEDDAKSIFDDLDSTLPYENAPSEWDEDIPF